MTTAGGTDRGRFVGYWARIAAALVAALLWPALARADDSRLDTAGHLDNAAIMALMSSVTLALTDIGNDNVVLHHLHPITRVGAHGRADIILPHAWDVETGIWWVEEDQFCVLYHHIVTARKRCFAVAKVDGNLRFIETRDEMPGHHIVRPYQWAQSARLTQPPPGSGVYKLLTDVQLVALLNANYLNVRAHDSMAEMIITFNPVDKPGAHGRMYSHPVKSGSIKPGTWWVEDQQFCIFWDNNVGVRKRCFSVAQDSGNYRLYETRWEQPGRVVDRPRQWVPLAQFFPRN